MRIPFVTLISLALLTSCAGVPLAKKEEGLPFVGTSKVQRFVLENGLELLVVEDHASPTFAYHTWFQVGSRDEVPGRTGLAHLFEHMMFKETKTLKDGEYSRTLEEIGAEGENAFTSHDYTAYVQELPKEYLELIIRLESDRMSNLVVNDQSFKTEREVVQNERRWRNENNPDGTMFQELFGVAFTKHSYRWPVIGYQEDLAAMSSPDAVTFYQTYYAPNHATIVVVGDVDAGDVLKLVHKYYGSYEPRDAKRSVAIEAEPVQDTPRRKTLKLPIQIEKLIVGYHIPQFTDPDMPTVEVMQAVLTGGKSSRLNTALVDTGIASSVEAYAYEGKDPSIFVIGVNLQKKKKAAQAEAVIMRELSRLAKEGIGDKELERAKNQISFHFYDNLGSNSDKAEFLGRAEAVTGTFEKSLEHYQKVQLVTGASLQAAAAKYFDPKNRSVITGVPK